ncbi:hypothetical protein, partial [Bradyrhizobium sp. NBAIM08]|uniref:hypothetical protein n=1 Tax=Bradyrhizobium sp. NBAIM08 TaxID=2793815 RepID=UPI001CD1AC49
GAGITPSFSTLPAPLMIARVTHGGEAFFSFDAMDASTAAPASFISVAQGIGAHSGSGIVSLLGYHRKIYIEVEADGPWTIEVIPAIAQERTEQLEFSGEGDIVTSAFLLKEGRVDVTFANEAKDSILVHMYPVEGDGYFSAETVVNDVGPYNG